MNTRVWFQGAVACTATALFLAPLAAQADVKVETLTHINEVTGISNHDSDTTDYYKSDRMREENLRKFTGSVLGAWQKFRGEDKGSMDIDIFDVPANKHYNVDPQKKVYSVESIYDPNQPSKAPPEGGTTRQRQEQQQEQQDKDVKVTKNEFTVKDTGKSQTINGFDTHEYLITWDYETQNTKTGETSKNLMTTDTWTSTDDRLVKAREAESSYEKSYRQLMHMPPIEGDNASSVYGLENGHVMVNGQDMKSNLEKLRTIKGLPVSTDIRWEVGGTDANGKAEGGNDDQSHPTSVDSALGSLFGHKSDDSSKEKAGTPGMTTVFSSHVEIKAIDTAAVDAAQFQPPSDYKLDD